jgi:predicted nucleic acid-binding protein
MSRYLLDADVLIEFSKRRESARSFIRAAIDAGDQLGVCAVNVAEFYAGLPSHVRPTWDHFVGLLQYWEITRATAARAGEYRYEFARNGQILATTDALVAAVARENQVTLVTGNGKDYPMSDIQLRPLVSPP